MSTQRKVRKRPKDLATIDAYAIELSKTDFAEGSIRQNSNIRPNCIFTADSHIVLYKADSVKMTKLEAVLDKIIDILRG